MKAKETIGESWYVIVLGCLMLLFGGIFLLAVVFLFMGAIYGSIGAGVYLAFKFIVGLFL